MLGPEDAGLLADHTDADVFDHDVGPAWAAEFLADPRHHIAAAIVDGRIVGFASGVHYVHPDKAPELWVNEVGVAESQRGRGLAKQLLRELFQTGQRLGCRQAWVLTDRSNGIAMRLYESAGGTAAPGDTVMFEFNL